MLRSKNQNRLLFWLLLAIYSTFFAEVVVGSAPLVFFKPDVLIITVPVYGLHILVLAPLIIRQGRIPCWQALYLTGLFFGLYEAYMTKVLWSPPWNPDAFSLGGVAVVDFIMLVLFWHPVMAFLVPMISAEWLLNLRPAIIPTIGEKWGLRFFNFRNLCIAGGVIGICLGAMLADPAVVLGSALSSTLVILLITWFCRKTNPGERIFMHRLLPDGRIWYVFILLLMIDYVILGLVLRPEALPPVANQSTIWVAYLVVFLLVNKARHSQPENLEEVEPGIGITVPLLSISRIAIILGILFSSALISSFLLPSIKNQVFLAVWGFGIPAGIFLFYRSVKWLFLPKKPQLHKSI